MWQIFSVKYRMLCSLELCVFERWTWTIVFAFAAHLHESLHIWMIFTVINGINCQSMAPTKMILFIYFLRNERMTISHRLEIWSKKDIRSEEKIYCDVRLSKVQYAVGSEHIVLVWYRIIWCEHYGSWFRSYFMFSEIMKSKESKWWLTEWFSIWTWVNT